MMILKIGIKMEGGNPDLLTKLKSEKDWNMSCILTDK